MVLKKIFYRHNKWLFPLLMWYPKIIGQQHNHIILTVIKLRYIDIIFALSMFNIGILLLFFYIFILNIWYIITFVWLHCLNYCILLTLLWVGKWFPVQNIHDNNKLIKYLNIIQKITKTFLYYFSLALRFNSNL